MEGEQFNIIGRKVIHYSKKYKTPHFQPHIFDIKAINRPYW